MVYSKLNINKILQAGFYRNEDLFIYLFFETKI